MSITGKRLIIIGLDQLDYHELEDVKERLHMLLNREPIDVMRRHFIDGRRLAGVKSYVDSMNCTLREALEIARTMPEYKEAL